MENTIDKKYTFGGIFWLFAVISVLKFYDFFFYQQEARNLLVASGFALMAIANLKCHPLDQKQQSAQTYIGAIGAVLWVIGFLMRFI